MSLGTLGSAAGGGGGGGGGGESGGGSGWRGGGRGASRGGGRGRGAPRGGANRGRAFPGNRGRGAPRGGGSRGRGRGTLAGRGGRQSERSSDDGGSKERRRRSSKNRSKAETGKSWSKDADKGEAKFGGKRGKKGKDGKGGPERFARDDSTWIIYDQPTPPAPRVPSLAAVPDIGADLVRAQAADGLFDLTDDLCRLLGVGGPAELSDWLARSGFRSFGVDVLAEACRAFATAMVIAALTQVYNEARFAAFVARAGYLD